MVQPSSVSVATCFWHSAHVVPRISSVRGEKVVLSKLRQNI
jgi:hypothetical protein